MTLFFLHVIKNHTVECACNCNKNALIHWIIFTKISFSFLFHLVIFLIFPYVQLFPQHFLHLSLNLWSFVRVVLWHGEQSVVGNVVAKRKVQKWTSSAHALDQQWSPNTLSVKTFRHNCNASLMLCLPQWCNNPHQCPTQINNQDNFEAQIGVEMKLD